MDNELPEDPPGFPPNWRKLSKDDQLKLFMKTYGVGELQAIHMRDFATTGGDTPIIDETKKRRKR